MEYDQNTALTPEIRADITRYRSYGWNWGIITALINRRNGKDYTAEALQDAFDKI